MVKEAIRKASVEKQNTIRIERATDGIGRWRTELRLWEKSSSVCLSSSSPDLHLLLVSLTCWRFVIRQHPRWNPDMLELRGGGSLSYQPQRIKFTPSKRKVKCVWLVCQLHGSPSVPELLKADPCSSRKRRCKMWDQGKLLTVTPEHESSSGEWGEHL